MRSHSSTHFNISHQQSSSAVTLGLSVTLSFWETQIPSAGPQAPSLDLVQEWKGAPRGCLGLPGQCKPEAAGSWSEGNWSAEAGAGSGDSGRWHEPEQGATLTVMWETEGLQTLGIVVLVCASLKLLHLLGLISFSEGKRAIERGFARSGGLDEIFAGFDCEAFMRFEFRCHECVCE